MNNKNDHNSSRNEGDTQASSARPVTAARRSSAMMQTHRQTIAALVVLVALAALSHATQLPLPAIVGAFVSILRAMR